MKIIKGNPNTPTIHLNPQKGILKIEGRSFPPEPKLFYTSLEEIIKYKEWKLPMNIQINLDYIETISSRYLLAFLKDLVKNYSVNSIEWIFEEDDEDIQELGNLYAKILHVSNFKMTQVISPI
jgi:hypothetical protein